MAWYDPRQTGAGVIWKVKLNSSAAKIVGPQLFKLKIAHLNDKRNVCKNSLYFTILLQNKQKCLDRSKNLCCWCISACMGRSNLKMALFFVSEISIWKVPLAAVDHLWKKVIKLLSKTDMWLVLIRPGKWTYITEQASGSWLQKSELEFGYYKGKKIYSTVYKIWQKRKAETKPLVKRSTVSNKQRNRKMWTEICGEGQATVRKDDAMCWIR